MTAFLSYSKKDRDAATVLRADLDRLRDDRVWIDEQLTGGQEWWNEILRQIRECDCFILALSRHSLRSEACVAEANYALQLQRPFIPVLVDESLLDTPLPQALKHKQVVRYLSRTPDEVIGLAKAVLTGPHAPPLPAVLPAEPPIPSSYLEREKNLLDVDSLSYDDQLQVLAVLRERFSSDDENRDEVRTLLAKLRDRRDVANSIAIEIQGLLSAGPATGQPSPPAIPKFCRRCGTPTVPGKVCRSCGADLLS